MKVLAYAAIALGVLMFTTAVVLGVVAIWTVGPDSARLAGTCFVVGFIGIGCVGVGVSALDYANEDDL